MKRQWTDQTQVPKCLNTLDHQIHICGSEVCWILDIWYQAHRNFDLQFAHKCGNKFYDADCLFILFWDSYYGSLNS